MYPTIVASIVLVSLILAILFGRKLHDLLPEHHRNDQTRDTVKLAVGLVGTMAALLLGLLVSSAKDSYNKQQTQVTQMAAKVAVLNRILALYGPDAAEVRKQFYIAVADAIGRLWPQQNRTKAELAPNTNVADALYFKIEALTPTNDTQQKLKMAAETSAVSLAELRALLVAQSHASLSLPMLLVVVSWLMIIFLGFSLLAPRNLTATLSLLISSLAVSGAIFLLLELDSPFSGLMRIPSEQMLEAAQVPEGAAKPST